MIQDAAAALAIFAFVAAVIFAADIASALVLAGRLP